MYSLLEMFLIVITVNSFAFLLSYLTQVSPGGLLLCGVVMLVSIPILPADLGWNIPIVDFLMSPGVRILWGIGFICMFFPRSSEYQKLGKNIFWSPESFKGFNVSSSVSVDADSLGKSEENNTNKGGTSF